MTGAPFINFVSKMLLDIYLFYYFDTHFLLISFHVITYKPWIHILFPFSAAYRLKISARFARFKTLNKYQYHNCLMQGHVCKVVGFPSLDSYTGSCLSEVKIGIDQ